METFNFFTQHHNTIMPFKVKLYSLLWTFSFKNLVEKIFHYFHLHCSKKIFVFQTDAFMHLNSHKFSCDAIGRNIMVVMLLILMIFSVIRFKRFLLHLLLFLQKLCNALMKKFSKVSWEALTLICSQTDRHLSTSSDATTLSTDINSKSAS